jgi:hypothetical protein
VLQRPIAFLYSKKRRYSTIYVISWKKIKNLK